MTRDWRGRGRGGSLTIWFVLICLLFANRLLAHEHEQRRQQQQIQQVIDLPPRVLVVVYGSLRGTKAAWKSLKRYVLDYYNADLALLSPPLDTPDQHKYLGAYAKHQWIIEEYEDWGQVLDSAVTDASERGKWKELCDYGAAFLGAINNCNANDPLSKNSSAGILLALRHLALQRIHNLRLQEQYDWFVYTRSDYIYLCSPPSLLSLRNDTLHIPRGEAYFGVTDRFLISPSSLILRALNITADVVNDYKSWIAILASDTKSGKGVRMIEWSLKRYLDKVGIYYSLFAHTGFTVQGVKDQTKFAEGHHDPILQHYGLRVKYKDEKKEAEDQCSVWNVFMTDNTPVVPEEGKLVQGTGKSIYLVLNQTLHYMNLDAFMRMGYEFSQVEFINDQVLVKLPLGDPM